MKIIKKRGLILSILFLLIVFSLSACGDTETTDTSETATEYSSSSDDSSDTTLDVEDDIEFPDEPVVGTYEKDVDATVTLNDTSVDISGSGIEAEGTVITITSAGRYIFSGTLSDGQIIVDTDDEDDKVEIVLNGVQLECSDNAPIYVVSSPKKTEIISATDSVNIISDSSDYDVDESDSDAPSAAIFSMDDLEFEGDGEIYVTGNYNKGIYSKDDLEFNGGDVYVTAVDDGVRGKDSVRIYDGLLYIVADGDGIRTSNDDDAEKGYIEISGGSVYVNAGLDAIQAITDVTISGGTFDLTSGGGSSNSSSDSDSSWGNWGNSSSSSDTSSAKAIKAGDKIIISDGELTIDSSDDAIHSNDSIEITGGTIDIESGDDGVHADTDLTINGGTITITECYEGIESSDIVINGGTIRVTASDDGFNAAGGSDSSSTDGRSGENSFSSSSGTIEFNDGYIVIDSDGDGIDSNGSVTMSGGTVIVFGPEDSDNGALDYDSSFTMTGGFLLALGSSGMAQSVTTDDLSVLAFTCGTISSGTIMNISDSSGNSLITFESSKTYECVVLCSDSIDSDETYTISTGGTCDGTLTDGIYYDGTYSDGSELGDVTAD